MLHIPRPLFDQMCDHARRGGEQEVCGVLVGRPEAQRVEQLVQGRNVAIDPAHHFTLDASTLLQADREARARGWEIVGFYHSHPGHSPFPSPSDQAMMWVDVPAVIIAVRESGAAVCGWQWNEARLQPCLLQVEPAMGEST